MISLSSADQSGVADQPHHEADEDVVADDRSSPVTAHSPKIASGGRAPADAAPGAGLAGGVKAPGSAGQGSSEERNLERRRAMSVWKKFAGRIEAWGRQLVVRTDPYVPASPQLSYIA